jgi:hypothetical protein
MQSSDQIEEMVTISMFSMAPAIFRSKWQRNSQDNRRRRYLALQPGSKKRNGHLAGDLFRETGISLSRP